MPTVCVISVERVNRVHWAVCGGQFVRYHDPTELQLCRFGALPCMRVCERVRVHALLIPTPVCGRALLVSTGIVHFVLVILE